MKRAKPKTLWLASWYPHPGQPTLGVFTQRDAEAVAPFCDLAVLSAVEWNGQGYEINGTMSEAGFREIRVFYPSASKQFRFLNIFRRWKAFRKGYRFLRKEGFHPDLLHLHVIYPSALAALWFHWRYHLPMVISEHWSGYMMRDGSFQGFQKWLTRSCAGRAKCILAVSPAMAASMQFHGIRGKYVVNPNVVNIEKVPIREKKGGGKFRFLHVSSLHDAQKNITGLLRSVKQLASLRTDFEFLVVGGDEGTGVFEQFTKSLQLEDIVRFRGVLPHGEVMQNMAESDAFVLFSNQEGLPCVMLEAMAVGLPVISTAIPGMEAWVTEQTGVLIEIGDEAALVEAMNFVMDNPGKYEAAQIRRVIEEKCSYPVVGGRIVAAYEEALKLEKSASAPA